MTSWKQEFDHKYNQLSSTGSISVIDRANDTLLRAIEGLDQIQKEIDNQEHPYNLTNGERIENVYGISCSGENTGCAHEDNPNIDQCLDCVYVKVRERRFTN